jgi:hypothetical protein
MPTTTVLSRNLTVMVSPASFPGTPSQTLLRLIALKSQFLKRTH